MADETKNITLKITPELENAEKLFDSLTALFNKSITKATEAQAKQLSNTTSAKGVVEGTLAIADTNPEVYRKAFDDFLKQVIRLARVLYTVNPTLQKEIDAAETAYNKAKELENTRLANLKTKEAKSYTDDKGKVRAGEPYQKEILENKPVAYTLYGGRGQIRTPEALEKYEKRILADLEKEKQNPGTFNTTRVAALTAKENEIKLKKEELKNADNSIVEDISRLKKLVEEATLRTQELKKNLDVLEGKKSSELTGKEGEEALKVEIDASVLKNKVEQERKQALEETTEKQKEANKAQADGTKITEKNTGAVSKAIQTFFGYQAILRALRTL